MKIKKEYGGNFSIGETARHTSTCRSGFTFGREYKVLEYDMVRDLEYFGVVDDNGKLRTFFPQYFEKVASQEENTFFGINADRFTDKEIAEIAVGVAKELIKRYGCDSEVKFDGCEKPLYCFSSEIEKVDPMPVIETVEITKDESGNFPKETLQGMMETIYDESGMGSGFGVGPLKEDMVNSPTHYNNGGTIECIDYIKDFLTTEEYKGLLRGNIAKYLHRFPYKGKPLEDVQKAQWYLSKLEELLKGES